MGANYYATVLAVVYAALHTTEIESSGFKVWWKFLRILFIPSCKLMNPEFTVFMQKCDRNFIYVNYVLHSM